MLQPGTVAYAYKLFRGLWWEDPLSLESEATVNHGAESDV